MKVLSGALVVAGRLAFATRHRKPSAASTRPPCSPFHSRTHFFPPGDFLFRGIIGTLRGSTRLDSRLSYVPGIVSRQISLLERSACKNLLSIGCTVSGILTSTIFTVFCSRFFSFFFFSFSRIYPPSCRLRTFIICSVNWLNNKKLTSFCTLRSSGSVWSHTIFSGTSRRFANTSCPVFRRAYINPTNFRDPLLVFSR